MLTVFAFVCFQAQASSASTVALTFIAECGQAVRGIKEGSLGLTLQSEGHSASILFLVKGESNLMIVTADDKPISEVLRTPTHFLWVNHAKRQYADVTYPARPIDPVEPLKPLEPGSFDLKFDPRYGFVLRVDPTFDGAKTSIENSKEVLTALIMSEGKEKARIRLERDLRSKLPTNLVVRSSDKPETKMAFDCQERPVSDADLTIKPTKFDGYAKVAPPDEPFGTL